MRKKWLWILNISLLGLIVVLLIIQIMIDMHSFNEPAHSTDDYQSNAPTATLDPVLNPLS